MSNHDTMPIRNAALIAVIGTAGALGISGCTSGESAPVTSMSTVVPAPETTVATPSQAITPESTSVSISIPEKSQYELNTEWLESPQRTNLLQGAATKAAERIVQAGESGELGKFSHYNYEQDGNVWNQEGWGYFQHNPQYGGSGAQLSIDVYMGADGTIDLSQGVRGVRIAPVPRNTSAFTEISNFDGAQDAWTTRSMKWDEAHMEFAADYNFGSDNPKASSMTVVQLQAEDAKVMADLDQAMITTFGPDWKN